MPNNNVDQPQKQQDQLTCDNCEYKLHPKKKEWGEIYCTRLYEYRNNIRCELYVRPRE
jgi:hypothetical protein